MENTGWEYKSIADRGKMHKVTTDELNELGKEGWELIQIMPDPTREEVVNYYFKRRLGGPASNS